jgi:outer membrane protein assembly factor BamB
LIPELDVVPHDVCGSTLLLHGDLLYACTSNGIDDRHDKIPKPDAPSLIALDKRTGRLVARDNETIGRCMLHCNWSSPSPGRVKGRDLIFFGGGDGVLYAFEPPASSSDSRVQMLRKVWSYDCNPPDFRMRNGQPVAYSKHNQNSSDGPSEVIGTPVFYSGRVYVAIGQSPLHGNGRGCLSCVDAATGAKVWASELVERTLATPSIADGLLYIPDTTGNLHCFDASTGKRHWVHPLGGKTWSASSFVADGKVYAGTEAGYLLVLQAGKELKVLSKTRLKTNPITLTAAQGVLYIPTQRSLLAVPGKPAAPPTARHLGPLGFPRLEGNVAGLTDARRP